MSTPCSLQSAALGEQLAGTAPVNRSWIVVEHNGKLVYASKHILRSENVIELRTPAQGK